MLDEHYRSLKLHVLTAKNTRIQVRIYNRVHIVYIAMHIIMEWKAKQRVF
jgi:hypothetical protein